MRFYHQNGLFFATDFLPNTTEKMPLEREDEIWHDPKKFQWSEFAFQKESIYAWWHLWYCVYIVNLIVRESNCLQLFLKVAGIVWMHCQISFLHLQMSWSVISKLIEAELCHLQDKYLLVSLLALVTIWKLNVVLKYVILSTMFVRRWFMYCVYMSLQHKMQASLIQPSHNGCLHFSCRLKRYVNAFVLQETLFL